MSYPEKRTIVSILTGIVILVAYCVNAVVRYQEGAAGPEDLRYWAITILAFIGIGVVATIIVQIIFHILLSVGTAVVKTVMDEKVDEKEIERSIQSEMVEDEMDKLIELKSMRISFVIAGIGFVTGLVYLALGHSPVLMLNIMFISFLVGSLVEGFTQLYYYRRGVYHA